MKLALRVAAFTRAENPKTRAESLLAEPKVYPIEAVLAREALLVDAVAAPEDLGCDDQPGGDADSGVRAPQREQFPLAGRIARVHRNALKISLPGATISEMMMGMCSERRPCWITREGTVWVLWTDAPIN